MSLFGRKRRHTPPPPSAPSPVKVPPFGSIVQPQADVTVPGRGVVATPRTPGRVVGDVEKRLPADQVFVEWYGGAITSIRVADLKPLWFEPERTPPQQPRRAPQQQFRPASPAGPRRVRTELITETPTDPNRPMGTPPPPQRMPDGSVAYTVYETVEPVDPSQLQEPAGRYRNPDGSWRYVTYETEEPA